ncbi:MAG: YidC/Oxa1 family membrane protein insertase [Lachnospiraceae bacterium]|nr:YidC/Oxa1 family membrane protein insertase [Lachnospiraceae bacterium]
MNLLTLTQYNGKILGPICKYILGPILNGIFIFLNWIHIPNIGLAIILFTVVIYLLMLPLTIKQQKFSKLQAKMQPELKVIQDKYKNRKDQDSQMAMNQETQAVYAKYGVSPTGSCLPLLVQMPVFFALYRVIYAVPAYVGIVRDAFNDVVSSIINTTGAVDFITTLSSAAGFSKEIASDAFVNGDTAFVSNTVIDILNRASTAEWNSIAEQFPSISNSVSNAMNLLGKYNNFLGINIGNSPSYTIRDAFSTGKYLLVLLAVLIPVLSAVTQWINTKLLPQTNTESSGNEQADQMAASMKAMNTFMPVFSAVICFTLPAGMGLYWIAGSVVRSIQQVAINKYIDKMDLDAEIKKNAEKRNARLKKAGIDPEKLMSNAAMSTRSVNKNSNVDVSKKDSSSYYNNNAKPGSIAAKANMVRQYNEKNSTNSEGK